MKMVETWYESLILFITLVKICKLRVILERLVSINNLIGKAFKHVNTLYYVEVRHA